MEPVAGTSFKRPMEEEGASGSKKLKRTCISGRIVSSLKTLAEATYIKRLENQPETTIKQTLAVTESDFRNRFHTTTMSTRLRTIEVEQNYSQILHSIAMRTDLDTAKEYKENLHLIDATERQISTLDSAALSEQFDSIWKPFLTNFYFKDSIIQWSNESPNNLIALRHWLNTQKPHETIMQVTTLSEHQGDVNCAIHIPAPKTQTIITGSDDSTIRVWDARQMSTPICHTTYTVKNKDQSNNPVHALCCISENTFISADRVLRLWHHNQEHQDVYRIRNLTIADDNEESEDDREQEMLTCMAPLSRNRIAAATDDGNIYIWNSTSTGSQFLPINKLEGHVDCINMILSPSLNRDLLVSCSDDATHRLWDPDRQANHPEQSLTVFGPKEGEREISLISELSGSGILISVFGHPGSSSASTPNPYRPDSESLSEESETHDDSNEAVASEEATLASPDSDHFYLFPAPKTPLVAEGGDDSNGKTWNFSPQNPGKVTAIKGLFMNNLVAIGLTSGIIEIWNFNLLKNEGECISTINAHKESVLDLHETDDCYLLSSSSDKTTIVCDMAMYPGKYTEGNV
ncbi:hypothetical protein [Kistimonas asteriae]|uniref:hypothetical protein n=1 Tax=Kistimonas asteriae TaxID=517724 RepID=UPI001BA4DBFF|nr:hypothetical protein [Kistimonas asteriae]